MRGAFGALHGVVAAAAVCVGLTGSLSAATLLGPADFRAADDLTVVRSGGIDFEFLDLSLTDAMTPAGALRVFGGAGFGWAGRSEVALLLSAFGTAYQGAAGQVRQLAMGATQRRSFVDHLGATGSGRNALGWYDTGTGANSYLCVAADQSCPLQAFTYESSIFNAAHPTVGVFMVRLSPVLTDVRPTPAVVPVDPPAPPPPAPGPSPAPAVVPLPAAWPLLAGALVLLGGLARRRAG